MIELLTSSPAGSEAPQREPPGHRDRGERFDRALREAAGKEAGAEVDLALPREPAPGERPEVEDDPGAGLVAGVLGAVGDEEATGPGDPTGVEGCALWLSGVVPLTQGARSPGEREGGGGPRSLLVSRSTADAPSPLASPWVQGPRAGAEDAGAEGALAAAGASAGDTEPSNGPTYGAEGTRATEGKIDAGATAERSTAAPAPVAIQPEGQGPSERRPGGHAPSAQPPEAPAREGSVAQEHALEVPREDLRGGELGELLAADRGPGEASRSGAPSASVPAPGASEVAFGVAPQAGRGAEPEREVSRVQPLPPELEELELRAARITRERAELVVGEGEDRVSLVVSADHRGVSIRATAGSEELRDLLARGQGELERGLERRGLGLFQLSTGTDREGGREREAPATREGGPVVRGAAGPEERDLAPPKGVRAVA